MERKVVKVRQVDDSLARAVLVKVTSVDANQVISSTQVPGGQCLCVGLTHSFSLFRPILQHSATHIYTENNDTKTAHNCPF